MRGGVKKYPSRLRRSIVGPNIVVPLLTHNPGDATDYTHHRPVVWCSSGVLYRTYVRRAVRLSWYKTFITKYCCMFLHVST